MTDSLMFDLEHKFARLSDVSVESDGVSIEGYASLFGVADQGGDIVEVGAYARSLSALAKADRSVKMLWQHNPTEPIGVWDDVQEDGRGLYVKGRLLSDVSRAREAAALLDAGAIDGLSIGYRTVRATKDDNGRRRLNELELWEVSLVTFPMLPDARVGGKGETPEAAQLRDLADVFDDARRMLARD